MVHASWWYYFSKFTEFMDTIFFVLRKKQDHVSTLHVIHHGVMPMSVWFGVKFTPGLFQIINLKFIYCFIIIILNEKSLNINNLNLIPGGHSTFFGFLNTFVHIVMYFYYMLSAFGPRVQKYLWWKKYLTTLQMVNKSILSLLKIYQLFSKLLLFS